MQKAKGTYDVYGEYGRKVLALENILKDLMQVYNYEYFRTPIFESTELFHRGVGDTTDIVTKETYDFKDRGDRDMTLRPEGTAGIVRSYIENKYYGNPNVPSKIWYYGPMYRYERPQSGRFREFYQFGVEVFGSNDPLMDAEVISIPVNLFDMLGLENIKVHINSIGDIESRNRYREALLEYFKPHLSELCDDCQNRYQKNPLRILDCKVDCDSDILKNAPIITDYLNEESKKYFDKVLEYLDGLGIEYVIDNRLVRGLDYYTHTVFEIEASSKELGKANIMCGGGRYNDLVETLGGPHIPAVGFGMGLERVLMILDNEGINLVEDDSIDCFIAPLTENEKPFCLALAQDLRLNGFKVEIDYLNKNLKGNFKQAENKNAKAIIIVGEDELNDQVLTVKNLKTKKEEKIDVDYIFNYLEELEFDVEDLGCDCGHEHCECHHDHE
jgi:histidyl-tRNA synthetase